MEEIVAVEARFMQDDLKTAEQYDCLLAEGAGGDRPGGLSRLLGEDNSPRSPGEIEKM